MRPALAKIESSKLEQNFAAGAKRHAGAARTGTGGTGKAQVPFSSSIFLISLYCSHLQNLTESALAKEKWHLQSPSPSLMEWNIKGQAWTVLGASLC